MDPLKARRAAEADLAACRQIRHQVFVRGQGIPPELEADGLDPECVHFVVQTGERLIGTARMREVDGVAKVERVAVLAVARERGAGRALMQAIEAEARARGFERVVLSAQEDVVGFYLALGYGVISAPFLEAGIPHREMHKSLAS